MKTDIKILFAASVILFSFWSCSKSDSDADTSSGTDTDNPNPIEVVTCASATGIDRIICLADAFKAELTTSQLASVQRTYSKSEAQLWSNFPVGIYRNRVGLNFGAMTEKQIQYAKALLSEVASSYPNEGYDEIQQTINADVYLQQNGGGSGYGAANYYIAMLGTPSVTGTFEIQFGGHHLAFANTYKDGVLSGATPSFRGIEPFGTFSVNNTINEPLKQEQAAFANMLNSLSASDQTAAKLNATFSDLLVGPQKDGNFPSTPSGLKCSNLTPTQKESVLRAIQLYVYDTQKTDTAAIMNKYTAQLNDTYIAYSGTTAMTARNDYVRIDGPSIWIEWSMQGGVITSGNHPHSVWRDKQTDYGGN